ncbi:MAG: hypothetical protein GXP04_08230 [Alphaproteobacteria bacterium]|nr:hypothetical protein [Alphaproteobacteria bacterium]
MTRYDRLQQIDELTRSDHHFISDQDDCYFLGEYTARRDWSFSPTNSAIKNFKILPTAPSKRQHWKKKAIIAFAGALNRIIGKAGCEDWTFVPVPSSKLPEHPDYDSRLLVTLFKAFKLFDPDIRQIVKQNGNRVSQHVDVNTVRSPDNFDYYIDETLSEPAPERITIFDDMITSGASYIAMKRILSSRFPNAEIRGLFLSRCVHEADIGFLDFD